MWRTDPDHRLQEITETSSPNGSRVDPTDLGRTRWAALGIEPDEDPHWRQHVILLERREVFRDFRFSFVSRTERTYHVSIDGDPIFGDDGTFQGYCETGRNITEEVNLKERKEELRTAYAELEATLDNIPEGILTYDPEGIIRSASAPMAQLSGYGIEELIGADINCLMTDVSKATYQCSPSDFMRQIEGIF